MKGTMSANGRLLRRRLGEVPLVALRVDAAVAAVAVVPVGRLLDDPCARVLRARVLAVEVVDDHVHERRLADDGRIAVSLPGLAEVDPAAGGTDLELGVHAARAPSRPHLLAEAERLREEPDRGRAVFVEQIGSDLLFHGAQARPPAPPCL